MMLQERNFAGLLAWALATILSQYWNRISLDSAAMQKNTGKRQPKFQDENQDPASQSREKRSCIENAKPLSKEGNVRSCSNK